MKTADEIADELGGHTMESGSYAYAWQRNAAIEIIRAALDEAYEAGRAAGVEEAAKVADDLEETWLNDAFAPAHIEVRQRHMRDAALDIAAAIRSLLPSPSADKETA